MDADFNTDELRARLSTSGFASADASYCPDDSDYRVDEVVKRSADEVTEVVYYQGAGGGELGPFVRKRISKASGLGSTYEALFRAQRVGARFRYLPRILDMNVDDERVDVIMEWVPGQTLEAVVEHEGPSHELACRLMPEICHAVEELHEGFDVPIIHRDIKPSNIMVGLRGYITLLDLGIARAWRPGAEADTIKYGTRGYAAPEQFGFGQTDVRSDVYSLGMVLYYLETGRAANGALSLRRLEQEGTDVRTARIIARATAFDPDDRYPSVRALRAALCEVDELHDSSMSPAASSTAGATTDGAAIMLFPVTKPRGSGAMLRKIPQGVGKIWNVVVVLFTLFVQLVGILAASDSTSNENDYPLWFYRLMFVFVINVPSLIAGYLVLDRRRLAKRFPILERVPYRRQLVYGFVLSLVSVFGIYTLGVALGIL